jgi:hypothetical protein
MSEKTYNRLASYGYAAIILGTLPIAINNDIAT